MSIDDEEKEIISQLKVFRDGTHYIDSIREAMSGAINAIEHRKAEGGRLLEALTWAVGFIKCNFSQSTRESYPDFRNAESLIAGRKITSGEFHLMSIRAELAESRAREFERTLLQIQKESEGVLKRQESPVVPPPKNPSGIRVYMFPDGSAVIRSPGGQFQADFHWRAYRSIHDIRFSMTNPDDDESDLGSYAGAVSILNRSKIGPSSGHSAEYGSVEEARKAFAASQPIPKKSKDISS